MECGGLTPLCSLAPVDCSLKQKRRQAAALQTNRELQELSV
jgi:hypothetical protein